MPFWHSFLAGVGRRIIVYDFWPVLPDGIRPETGFFYREMQGGGGHTAILHDRGRPCNNIHHRFIGSHCPDERKRTLGHPACGLHDKFGHHLLACILHFGNFHERLEPLAGQPLFDFRPFPLRYVGQHVIKPGDTAIPV